MTIQTKVINSKSNPLWKTGMLVTPHELLKFNERDPEVKVIYSGIKRLRYIIKPDLFSKLF